MKHKFAVLIISNNKLQDEVYEFKSFCDAQAYAKARNEIYDRIYLRGTLNSLFRPKVIISGLYDLNDFKKKNLRRRSNEMSEAMTQDIRKKIEEKYMPKIRQKMSKRDLEIVECYEKAGLAEHLYGALNEENEENFRNSIQVLADSILNEEVMPTLCDIGYVF